ncbi:MAG: GTP-binding protein [Candidatus Paceibacterota bacterium]
MQSSLGLIPKKKPVTLITGFLGAGKTTLLKRILTENHGQKIAVIVNEFGEVGIDDKLIVEESADMVKLTNGCICCTMKNETATTLINMLDGKNDFERVVIETTGLANPLPILKNFLSEQFIKEHYTLDAVIAVVDAKNVKEQLDTNIETKEQIAYADLILLNKLDLVSQEEAEQIKVWLKAINQSAKIIETERSNAPIEDIFDLQRKEKDYSAPSSHSHIEDAQINSFVLETDKPISKAKLQSWLSELVLLHSADLLRYKGIFYVKDHPERFVLQGVHTVFELTEDRLWRDGEEQKTQVVFIGRSLDKELFEAGFRELTS